MDHDVTAGVFARSRRPVTVSLPRVVQPKGQRIERSFIAAVDAENAHGGASVAITQFVALGGKAKGNRVAAQDLPVLQQGHAARGFSITIRSTAPASGVVSGMSGAGRSPTAAAPAAIKSTLVVVGKIRAHAVIADRQMPFATVPQPLPPAYGGRRC